MSNKVKIALIIIFLLAVVVLDILIQNYIDSSLENMENKIETLKISLLEENYDKSKEKSEDLKKEWSKHEEKYGYFMDHEEIEKLSTKITIINENTINSEYKLALEDSIEAKYLVKHIKDKLKLKLSNVF